MSTNKELLGYEISLLLMRHGRSAVLNELARQSEQSEADLWRELERLKERRARGEGRKRSAADFSIQQVIDGRPEAGEALKSLDARFNNRTFLPELRDVKRFLEQKGSRSVLLKSRTVAKRKVFEVLARMDLTELEDLLRDASAGSNSSLGIISDQILRRRGI